MAIPRALLLVGLLGLVATPPVQGEDLELHSLRIEAVDLQDGPVAGAKIYAFNSARMMFGAEGWNPTWEAGTTDAKGRLAIEVPGGDWQVLGVGQTTEGRPWLVIAACSLAGPESVQLAPDRSIEVTRRSFTALEGADLELWVRPSDWPSWWKPVWLENPAGGRAKSERLIEAGLSHSAEVWLRSKQPMDGAFVMSRVELEPRDKALTLEPPGRQAATLRVAAPHQRDEGTDVFFVLEAADFHSDGHPFLYPVGEDEIVIEVPRGEYILRHYVEWFDGQRRKWHAEFANEHIVLGKRKREYEYETSDRFDVHPVVDVRGPDQVQFWLQGTDRAGRQLDWLTAPGDAVYGALRLYDAEGNLARSVDVNKTRHFWLRHAGSKAFPEKGTYELELDFLRWKVEQKETEYEEPRWDEVQLPHLLLRYPRGAEGKGPSWIEKQAKLAAPLLEALLVEAWKSCGVEPAGSVELQFQLCPTRGSHSSENKITLPVVHLLRGGPRSTRTWGPYMREVGYCLRRIAPLGPPPASDPGALFRASQASFLGRLGSAEVFGAQESARETAFDAQGVLRKLRGEREGIGDERSRVAYLLEWLARNRGDSFASRLIELSHSPPHDLRDRVMRSGGSPAEVIAALVSIAAESDITTLFRAAGLKVGPDTGRNALRLRRDG